jgi:nucleoside-diphosphate-sugar epimerase
VLVDLAERVWAGQEIDVGMGDVNVIWQGDAIAMTIRAFDCAASPPFILNVAGPELLSVRRVCEQLAKLLGKQVKFTGQESPNAFLNNGQLGHRLFGYPQVSAQQMMIWIADWVKRGGEKLGKPTHFETRDGRF